MKRRFFCGILAVLGLAMLAFTGALAFQARELPVVLLSEPVEARTTVWYFLDALNQGALAEAGQSIYGQPNLSENGEFDTQVAATMWRAYVQSLEGSLSGTCYATDAGLYQDVTISALDIQGILPSVEYQYEALLSQRSQEQGDAAINLEDGSYREEFVLSVLEEAVQSALNQEMPMVSHTVSLSLVYRENRWWILPQSGLMDILAGGMTVKGGY